MPIVAKCSNCAASMRLADTEAYKQVDCTWCGRPVRVGPPGSTPEILVALAKKRERESGSLAKEEKVRKPRFSALRRFVPAVNWLAHVAFFSASAGLLAVSWPWLRPLALPLTGLAVVLGLLAVAVPAARNKSRLSFALSAGLLGLCAFLYASWEIVWPWWAMRKATPPAESAEILGRFPIMHRGNSLLEDQPGSRAEEVPAKGDWVDAAKDVVQKGDLRVRVLAVRLGRIELAGADKPAYSEDSKLTVRLRISNVGTKKRFDYQSWGDADRKPPRNLAAMKDDRDRDYRPIGLGKGVKATGAWPGAVLPPGKYVDEVLIFEPPTDDTNFLRLELPAAAFGDSGVLRLQIPWSLVKVGGDA